MSTATDLRAQESATAHAVARIHELALDPAFELPALPSVAAEITELAQGPDVDFRRVDAVVRGDPMIAARVLSVASSPVYASSTPVVSLRAAMMRLGWATLRDVLWQVIAESYVFRGPPGRRLQAIRTHSVGVGHINRTLCQSLGMDTEYAFICGLLHDLGRPMALKVLHDHQGLEPRADPLAIEDRAHTTVGHEIAVAWDLPEIVGQTIAHHHDTELEGLDPMVLSTIAAERIARHHGLADRRVELDGLDPVFARLGLDQAMLDETVERTESLKTTVY